MLYTITTGVDGRVESKYVFHSDIAAREYAVSHLDVTDKELDLLFTAGEIFDVTPHGNDFIRLRVTEDNDVR